MIPCWVQKASWLPVRIIKILISHKRINVPVALMDLPLHLKFIAYQIVHMAEFFENRSQSNLIDFPGEAFTPSVRMQDH